MTGTHERVLAGKRRNRVAILITLVILISGGELALIIFV